MALPFPYFWQNFGHTETAARALLSRASIPWQQERITTPDNDFLDLFWYQPPLTSSSSVRSPSASLLVFCHGLAGDHASTYIGITVQALQHTLPLHCLAWNYRSCSAELNKQPRFYHLGETQDLRTVLAHARHKGYTRIILVGFSAGGSIVLNTLGKHPEAALALGVVGAVAISTPIDLEGCARQLETPGSLFYNHRFCKNLSAKVLEKAAMLGSAFPLSVKGIGLIKTLRAFDEAITAPLHGFASASDYYQRCSALALLHNMPVPVTLVAARNDPFLSPSCLPSVSVSKHWPAVTTQLLALGGHCGYPLCTGAAIVALANRV